MADFSIKADLDALRDKLYIMGKQFTDLKWDDPTLLEIYDLYAKMIDPWVPMREGVLAQSVQVSSEGLKYPGPYAHYQYMGIVYGPNIPIFDKDTGDLIGWRSPKGKKKHPTDRKLRYSTEKHPLASSHWDKAMMEVKGDEFRQQVMNILVRRFEELYG